MKFKQRFEAKAAEMDMTSMIDMVFQLIIFFMVLINFSQDDQNDKIKLPTSELAKPADAPLKNSIYIHLGANSAVYMGSNTATVESLAPLLRTEITVLEGNGESAKTANLIIRADQSTPGGVLQDLIKRCQELGFEQFTLRVKEQD
ncbi:biopolymer transport protein ExbD [Pirellula sp. SH-Sr6A]|uniref:ExbD/TolR family protein n=1 Tax=Pirellula sp. SH-Sr6A TaxID=1632865 RepID=UPI00078D2200|nr:biopolymer transporter ExbD [Pirellula sp. SH-Sr6A]AMV33898.1 biopolymer transport protein ExbD [Pirellula sp. SH-Sr6A]